MRDVVVIGAGPAGSLAARELARKGRDVLLVERATFPRYKVCGGCLHPLALARLAEVGLGELCSELGAEPLRAVELASSRRRARIDLPTGAVLPRTLLDGALAEAARAAGAELWTHTPVLRTEALGDRRLLHLRRDGREVELEARVVLGAAGLGGDQLAPELAAGAVEGSRVGAGAELACLDLEPGLVAMACGREGYVGVVRFGAGGLAAAALDRRALRRHGSVEAAVDSILVEAGSPLRPQLECAVWKGTPALTRRVSRPAAPRAFLIGDGAGYVEPFTGEGMAWALTSAVAVAPWVELALDEGWNEGLERGWTRAHDRALGRHRRRCGRVTRFLRRPRLVAGLVRALSTWPALGRPLAQYGYAREALGA